MYKRKLAVSMIIGLLTLSMAMAAFPAAFAQTNPTLTVVYDANGEASDGTSSSVGEFNVGETFSIIVEINTGTYANIWAWQNGIYYDPTILECTGGGGVAHTMADKMPSASEGNLFFGLSTLAFQAGTIDDVGGKVSISANSLTATPTPAVGTYDLMYYDFLVKDYGSCQIGLTESPPDTSVGSKINIFDGVSITPVSPLTLVNATFDNNSLKPAPYGPVCNVVQVTAPPIYPGDTVTFDGSGSTNAFDGDAIRDIIRWNWSYGDLVTPPDNTTLGWSGDARFYSDEILEPVLMQTGMPPANVPMVADYYRDLVCNGTNDGGDNVIDVEDLRYMIWGPNASAFPSLDDLIGWEANCTNNGGSYDWVEGSAACYDTTWHIYPAPGVYTVTLTILTEAASAGATDPATFNSTMRTATCQLSVTVFAAATGRNIDVYTCTGRQHAGVWYPSGSDGVGPGLPADEYQPQEPVCICANVTYNGDEVQFKLVGFEIHNEPNPYMNITILRTAYTNSEGIACINFTIPWPCVDEFGQQLEPWQTEEIIFGCWTVEACVDIVKVKVCDNLTFTVHYIVEIVADPVTKTLDPLGSVKKCEYLLVEFEVVNHAMLERPALIIVVAYDELGVPVALASLEMVIPGTGPVECAVPEPYPVSLELHIPKWAFVGLGTVYINVYDAWPLECGLAWGPEVSALFQIEL